MTGDPYEKGGPSDVVIVEIRVERRGWWGAAKTVIPAGMMRQGGEALASGYLAKFEIELAQMLGKAARYAPSDAELRELDDLMDEIERNGSYG